MTIKEIIEKQYEVLDRLLYYGVSEDRVLHHQQETIRLVLEGVRDWVSENEYCSKCCSPKKHCPEWGKNASAIDTKDFLALLTQELKDLDK